MSIIQEALHKAQVDVKAPEARQDGSQVKNTYEVKTALKPAVKKIKGKTTPVMKILTSLLLIVLAAFAVFSAKQFLSSGKKSQDKISDSPTQEVTYRPIVKTDAKISDDIGPQGQTVAAASLKDIAGHPSLMLNGIMYLEERPRAIINNSIVEAGDSVGGATVTKINPKNVVLEYNDVEITLNLK